MFPRTQDAKSSASMMGYRIFSDSEERNEIKARRETKGIASPAPRLQDCESSPTYSKRRLGPAVQRRYRTRVETRSPGGLES